MREKERERERKREKERERDSARERERERERMREKERERERKSEKERERDVETNFFPSNFCVGEYQGKARQDPSLPRGRGGSRLYRQAAAHTSKHRR